MTYVTLQIQALLLQAYGRDESEQLWNFGGVFEMRGIDLQSTSTREGRIDFRELSTLLEIEAQTDTDSVEVDMSRHNEMRLSAKALS